MIIKVKIKKIAFNNLNINMLNVRRREEIRYYADAFVTAVVVMMCVAIVMMMLEADNNAGMMMMRHCCVKHQHRAGKHQHCGGYLFFHILDLLY